MKHLLAAFFITLIGFQAVAAERRGSALDSFMNQSANESRGVKKAYDERQRLTRTSQFKPEDKAVVVELGGAIPENMGVDSER